MLKVAKIYKSGFDISASLPSNLIDLLTKLNEIGEFYLVGGSIRDALLHRKPKDFDIMVVSPPPEVLEKILPLQKVGAAFPVYLYDTKTPELGIIEIAYARKEVKTGVGYKGFDVKVVNNVKEDLARRDLTINALAWNPTAGLVSLDDRSMEDISSHTLRHVTEAFSEDPLRVLRAARMSAQLPGDWVIDSKTLILMRGLKGELQTLPLSRIRQELEKALMAPKPGNFFLNLHEADCMDWFPELDANLDQCVALVNRMAKTLPLIEMYYMLAQAMQSSADIRTFCKRLDLACGREMELWHFMTHCSFTTPEDYLTFFRSGKSGKLTFELIYPLMQKVGLGSEVTKLQAVETALKSLDYRTVKPQEIPKLMRDTVVGVI